MNRIYCRFTEDGFGYVRLIVFKITLVIMRVLLNNSKNRSQKWKNIVRVSRVKIRRLVECRLLAPPFSGRSERKFNFRFPRARPSNVAF